MDTSSHAFAFFCLGGARQQPKQSQTPQVGWRTPVQADLEGSAQHAHPVSGTGALSLFITSLRAGMSGRNDGPLMMLFEAGQ